MGGGQHALTPFQPPNQAGAASAFQAGAGQLANAGSQLYGSVSPELAGISQQVLNNPYYANAQAGAGAAATNANNYIVPSMYRGAGQDSGIAGLSALAAPQYNTAAQNNANTAGGFIPGTTGGAAYAPSALSALAGAGGQTYGLDLGALGALGTTGLSAANSILNTGFDPQRALYDQQYAQTLDQQNAINAQSGVVGPYAAGATGMASNNFNIDWQNAQLNRQIAALGAYNGAASTFAGDTSNLTNSAMGNLASGIGSGVNAYTGLTSNTANNAATLLGASNQSLNTGAGALSALGATTVGANAGASQLGQDALNTQAGAAQLQYDLANQKAMAGQEAILGQVQGTNASLGPTQQAVVDYGNYMNIGQTAAQGAIQAAQVNNQAAQASAAGFGSLFGDVLGLFAPISI